MSLGKPFLPGRAKTGGRVKGSRNKISEAFLKDLAAEWEVSGSAALKVMSKEDPSGFVKVTAALLPKEFEITDSRLNDMSDDELDLLINEVRARVRGASISDPGSRENPTATASPTTSHIRSRKSFTTLERITAKGCFAVATSLAKPSLAQWKRPCTPPGAIRSGGKANGSTSQRSDGRAPCPVK